MVKPHVSISYLSNNRGFSLAETMVAAGMAGAISLAVVGIMKSAAFFEQSTQSKEIVISKLARLGYELQLYLQQAIDITTTAAPFNNFRATPHINDGGVGVGGGRLSLAFDSDAVGVVPDGTQRVDTVALFISENGSSFKTGATATLKSQFRGIGIFYQHNEPLTSGAVYISTRSIAAGNQNIDPDANSSIFDGMVGFSVDNVRVIDNAVTGQATNVQFHAIARYFTGPNRTTFARWCHPARMGGGACPAQINYVDVERVFNVVLRNNRLPRRRNGVCGQRGGISDVVNLFGTVHFFNSLAHRGGDLY